MRPPLLLDDAVDRGQAQAGPFADWGLVVKNGSKMRASVALSMPQPVSLTASMA